MAMLHKRRNFVHFKCGVKGTGPSVGPDFSLRYVNTKQTHKTQFYTNGNLELENMEYSPASSAIHVVERRTINHLKLKLK